MENTLRKSLSSDGKDDKRIELSFALSVVGFSCLIAWELSVVFSPSLPLLSFCAIQDAIAIRCVSVLTLAAAFGFFAWHADWFYVNKDKLLLPALIVAFLPMVAALANSVCGPLPAPLLFIPWGLHGVAQAIFATYWCIYFSTVRSSFTMKSVVSGGVGGTLLFVVVNAAGELWVSMLEMCLMLALSVSVTLMLSHAVSAGSTPQVTELRKIPDLSGAALFSVASCGAVYGFMTIEVCYQGFAAALIGGASGIVGVALALLWCLLGSRVDIDVGVVQRISLPLLVASLLLMPLFEGALRVFWACVALAALAHNQMFTWYSVSIENYEFRLHPVSRFCLRQAPSWIGFFAGCILAFMSAFVFKLEGYDLYLLTGVFAIVLVAAFSIYGGDESKTKEQFNLLLDVSAQTAAAVVQQVDEAVQEPQDKRLDRKSDTPSLQTASFQDRCNEVSRQYCLTPRETEVFSLLAKGRNAEFIANQLAVTPATVKSHIYHIYQKLSVNSQQRLIDLIDEGER